MTPVVPRVRGAVRWAPFALAVLVAVGCRSEKSYQLPLLTANTSKLKHTTIVTTLGTALKPDQNLIYCATFQLAWNELMAMAGGPVSFKALTSEVRDLNRGAFKKHDVDPKSLRVEVKRELLGQRIRIRTELTKNLLFPKPFSRRPQGARFVSGKLRQRVWAFHLDEKSETARRKQLRQVEVIDYRGPTDYIVRLRTRSRADHLVLARVPPGRTLRDTYRAVEVRIRKLAGKTAPARMGDQLIVPMFNFDLTHTFQTLLGKQLENQRLRGYVVEEAQQRIKLRLDEKGARLYSSSELKVTCSKRPSPKRLFDFAAPHLMYMRQTKSAVPYFLMWVAHPEILVAGK